MIYGCGKKGTEQVSVQVRGSDTEVNLVQRLAEEFMKTDPDLSISVTGGGSGTGIAALINKQTDIANSSRSMKEKELQQAKDKGVDPVGIVFALDGLALIVHESVAVDSLNLGEVAKIFKGEITTWSEVGGPDTEISLYGRQSNSGTYVYFRDNVLKGDYSLRARRMNGTSQIVEAVKQDKAAIGYVGIGYAVNEKGAVVPGLKVLNISKDERSAAVSPLEAENVKSGLYSLSRPLYQYTDGKPSGKILEFIQFELSEKGQQLVEKEGYYPVTPEHVEGNRKLGIVE